MKKAEKVYMGQGGGVNRKKNAGISRGNSHYMSLQVKTL